MVVLALARVTFLPAFGRFVTRVALAGAVWFGEGVGETVPLGSMSVRGERNSPWERISLRAR